MTILYNRQFNRPTSDTVETNITQLGQLSGISRTHHTRDNMLWLEDMQYISDVENQYGLVRFRINTELIVAAPEAATAGSGSPSDCAVSGGHNNHSPSITCPSCESENIRAEQLNFGTVYSCADCRERFNNKDIIQKRLSSEIKYLGTDFRKQEKERTCHEKKPEEEVEGPKVHSERSQKNSTSPTVKKLKLKPRFTTE